MRYPITLPWQRLTGRLSVVKSDACVDADAIDRPLLAAMTLIRLGWAMVAARGLLKAAYGLWPRGKVGCETSLTVL